MRKPLIPLLMIVLMATVAGQALAAKDTDSRIKALEKRLQKLEIKAAHNKIDFGGDLRVEAHSLTGEVPDFIDGMRMQALFFETMFAMQDFDGDMAPDYTGDYSPADLDQWMAANFANYQVFQGSTSFNDLRSWVQNSMADPVMGPMMAQMQEDFAQDAYRQGYKTDNDILYTTRLRLNMHAKVASNVSFNGRMSMYKPWGASTQTGLFNGQSNTLNTDANWPGVPGDANLFVERAFFSWNHLAGQPMYLSLGRRPSTAGPPLNLRQDEPRGGTPMGTVIDFQFDGATLGYQLTDKTELRACYGLGYESQYGNATLLQRPADRLKDASFFGFNIDAWNTPEMLVQTTIARAFNITDGFNGYVIMPNDPVSGSAMPGPIVTRFNPSVNLGDFDLASVLLQRRDGPLDWFISGSWTKSRPDAGVVGPFGGLLCDPFENPEEHTGSMYYLGARVNFNDDMTKVGLEWNKGSQYWFNFAPAQDDLISPKTSTRGTVIEAYLTHRVSHKFMIKVAYIDYSYDYSGSGWHVGAPKDLDSPQMLGFPTYKDAAKLSLGFTAKF